MNNINIDEQFSMFVYIRSHGSEKTVQYHKYERKTER